MAYLVVSDVKGIHVGQANRHLALKLYLVRKLIVALVLGIVLAVGVSAFFGVIGWGGE